MAVAAMPAQPPSQARVAPRHPWLDPAIAVDTLPHLAAAAGRDWAFAWIERARGVSLAALTDALRSLDVAVLGGAGAYVRVRVPAATERLRSVAALPGVIGLGATPADIKLDSGFAARVGVDSATDVIPVFVSLMDNDAGGRWRRELERLGLVVGAWDAQLRSYSANLPKGALSAVLAADFVLAVEPVAPVFAAHDTAVPVMGADRLRRLDPSTGLFGPTAGQAVPIGVMDTGLNVQHPDVMSGRESICGSNFIAEEDYDLWLDLGRHGTHVTGTIAGSGALDPTLSGMAPGVKHLRFAKVLSSYGSGSTANINQGMDYLATASRCVRSGEPSASVKPLIVNMSLAARGLAFSGRGVGERKLDATVWAARQLYVVAQANSGVHGFSNYGTAKNSLSVGAMTDTGSIASFSSHGPTADGRLAPNLVGTGVGVYSVRGSGQRSGYDSFNGTSMASPSVAGVAALLMDAEPLFRGQPALVRARLMASAVKPDPFLVSGGIATDNTAGPEPVQKQYGLGLASARLSVLQRDEPDGWTSGAAVRELEDGQYAYVDIEVPDGANRLDLVMTWDEAPADAVTESVLNDLDLWLDEGADCASPACGEHSSRSRVDNVEWIILRQPPPGTHRVKIVAERIHGEKPRAAVAWTVIRGTSTPRLQLTPSAEVIEVGRGEPIEIDLALTVDAYAASGASLHFGTRQWNHSYTVRTDREDGTTRAVRLDSNDVVPLGEIGAGEEQRVTVTYSSDSSHRLYLTATAWNATGGSAYVDIHVDRTGIADDPAVPPANDHFANAETLIGDSGDVIVDLTRATREPGEPEVERILMVKNRSGGDAAAAQASARSRSAWFSWRAPATSRYTFQYPGAFPFGGSVSLAVYEGDELAALSEVGANRDERIAFNAVRDRLYRIRVATTAYRTYAHRLSWDGGHGRPTNDDFASRQRIEGEEGSIAGNNQGAGLERGEFLPRHTATVWYQWTAPESGYWTFRADDDDKAVLAFTGESVFDLRLVSSIFQSRPTFETRGGDTYQIAVAARGTETAGTEFKLFWRPATSEDLAGNDRLASATVLAGSPGRATVFSSSNFNFTVEPGEPFATGTHTSWWRWRAPAERPHTFRLTGRDADTFMVNVFSGNELAELEWLKGGVEFAVDAEMGKDYAIAVGKRYDATFEYTSADLALNWGETPANDLRTGATELAGASGSVTASHEFATMSPEESVTVAGHSALWWKWTAPRRGWYRFRVEKQKSLEAHLQGVLAIHGIDGDGNPELIGTTDRSYVLSGDPETSVLAGAGDTYLIQVAARLEAPPGRSSFRWSPADAPDWLRYSGRHADGDALAEGGSLALESPRSLAMDDTGQRLFVAASDALQVFDRDGKTGRASPARSIPYRDSSGNDLSWLSRSRLHWEPGQALLYGFHLRRAALFRLSGSGAGSVETCALEEAEGIQGYYTNPPLVAAGKFLYLIGRTGIAVYRIESPCEFSLVQILSGGAVDHPWAEQLPELTDMVSAAMGPDGTYLYLAREGALTTLERDADSGRLRLISENSLEGLSVASIALDASGEYLFVAGRRGPRLVTFDVHTRSGIPTFLAYTPHFYMDTLGFRTHFDYPVTGFVGSPLSCAASVPGGNASVDIVCNDSAYVARWDAGNGKLVVSDWFSLGAPDRFGNELPAFGFPSQAVQSPDGSFLYVVAPRWPHTLLTFQRARSLPLP